MLTSLKESWKTDVRVVYRLKALRVRVSPTSQNTKRKDMKKIFTTIKEWANRFGMWWMLHLRNTLLQEVEFDAYKVTFRRFTMDITTKSGNMKLRTMCMQYPQGYLSYCLEHGSEKQVEWFCNQLYHFVSLITVDQGLANDVHKSFAKFYKRMDKKAESIAKEITLDEDKLNEEVVKANIEVAKMTKVGRKAHKEAIRELLTQEEN